MKTPSRGHRGGAVEEGISSLKRHNPRTNFEAATMRLVELYDFAPIAYVSFDRFGRIQEINFAAANLLGRPRNALLGKPFAVCIVKKDRSGFLRHLLHCRTREKRVETDLSLIGKNEEYVPVRLSSTPTASFASNGAILYQTVIFDQRERLAAETALRKSEQRFRRYFDLGLIGMAIYAPNKRFLEANERLCQLLGYRHSELLEKKWPDLTHPGDLDRSLRQFGRVIAGETDSYTLDRRWIRKDGHVVDTIVSVSAVRLDNGTIDYFVALIEDVTERKRAGEALLVSEHRYRTLFDVVPIAVYTCDADGLIRQFNRRAVELWGAAPGKEGARKKFCGSFKIFYPDGKSMPHRKCPMARILRGESLAREDLEIIIARKNGERRNVIAHPQRLINEAGEIIGAINCLYDITERKRVEEALGESERRFAVALKTSGVIVGTMDRQLRFTWVHNHPLLKPEQILGRTDDEILGKQKARELMKLKRAVLETGRPERREITLELEGKSYSYDVTIEPLFDERDEVNGLIEAALDITGRKAAEERLREGDERFRLLVDNARDYAMFMLTPDNVIRYWNAGAERVFGWSAAEAVGQCGDLIFTPEDRREEQVEKEIERARKEKCSMDRRWHLRKDGSRIWIDGVMRRIDDEKTGEVRGYAKIGRDATDLRIAEEALQRARDDLEQRVVERTTELIGANRELQQEIQIRQRLEHEILAVTERERARISQDLHDSLCQELTATAFLLNSEAKKYSKRDPGVSEALHEAATIVNANAGRARDFARGLHPFELESTGLIQTLRELASRTNEKVPCCFEGPDNIAGLDDGSAVNLYRIGQEAVTNAVKHAQPNAITLKLQRSNGEIVLSVSDDGKGLVEKGRKQGMGIHLMKYRANVSGGILEIDSKRGRGTTVRCRVPIKK